MNASPPARAGAETARSASKTAATATPARHPMAEPPGGRG
jgi:hypothetical protein